MDGRPGPGIFSLFAAAGMGDSINFVIAHPEGLDHQRPTAIFKEELRHLAQG